MTIRNSRKNKGGKGRHFYVSGASANSPKFPNNNYFLEIKQLGVQAHILQVYWLSEWN